MRLLVHRVRCRSQLMKRGAITASAECAAKRRRFLLAVFPVAIFPLAAVLHLAAEPLPLKHAVELALSHSTAAAASEADEQRAFASYHEIRNQYIPQVVAGAGLGASWGFPLSLEGAAPSLFNLNTQSALLNPALRDFVRAARSDWQASTLQSRDQHSQVIQDTVLTYVELAKWQSLLSHLQQAHEDARKMEEIVGQRIQEGVDNANMLDQARLTTARAHLRMTEARGAIEVLRNHLAQLTGLPASGIDVAEESIPALPVVNAEDDLPGKAVQSSPVVQAADTRAGAESLRARGEHRSLLPSVDFAAQYAVLSRYNNYDQFYKSFDRNNATVGVAIRFPFLNPSQHARAQAADAAAMRAKKDAQSARNQVSQETLKLQRTVEQLAAAQEVTDLEYKVAHSSLEATQVRVDAGTATLHDLADARTQADDRYNALQDANFQLERAHIALLRATGELEGWLGMAK